MCRDGRYAAKKNRALQGLELEREKPAQAWASWVPGLLRCWASDPAILLKLVAGRQRGKRAAAGQ